MKEKKRKKYKQHKIQKSTNKMKKTSVNKGILEPY